MESLEILKGLTMGNSFFDKVKRSAKNAALETLGIFTGLDLRKRATEPASHRAAMGISPSLTASMLLLVMAGGTGLILFMILRG